MRELELAWNRTMCMWWLLVWRRVVGGAVLGFFAGAVGAVVPIYSDLLEYAATFGAVFGYRRNCLVAVCAANDAEKEIR